MRFFATAVFGLAAVALAQETTTATSGSEVASSASSAPSTATSLSAEARCLADCGDTDICCKAACVNVPCPNEQDVNGTTTCAGQCIQGNGTEEETAAYASCQASCISASFFPVSTGAAGSGSNTASGAEATATGESATGVGADASSTGADASRTASESGSSASASATGSSGASNVKVVMSGAGLLGLLAAGIAL